MHELVSLLENRSIAILTGAGCSTESGIPDYRGPGTRARARNPMQHREFVGSEAARRRYWARSALGWPRISSARPNAAHQAIAHMESRGLLAGTITQNVDRLHQKAGSKDVIELHGALADVRCLACDAIESREEVQERILGLNPSLRSGTFDFAPDGDAEVDAESSFVVPTCQSCDGTLKPDVVFFGGSVPADRVARAYGIVDRADVLLVVGSSLAVFSGYRLVLRARARSIPIAIVNIGDSRGDGDATVRIDAHAGEVLPLVAASLGN